MQRTLEGSGTEVRRGHVVWNSRDSFTEEVAGSMKCADPVDHTTGRLVEAFVDLEGASGEH